MRGRPRKSLAAQIIAGDPRRRGRHKLAERLDAGPQPTPGLPPCPKHLTGLARERWQVWAERLIELNLDKRPDGVMLEGCCIAYARAVEAERILRAKGLIVSTPSGRKQRHPAWDVAIHARAQLKLFMKEFGFFIKGGVPR